MICTARTPKKVALFGANSKKTDSAEPNNLANIICHQFVVNKQMKSWIKFVLGLLPSVLFTYSLSERFILLRLMLDPEHVMGTLGVRRGKTPWKVIFKNRHDNMILIVRMQSNCVN